MPRRIVTQVLVVLAAASAAAAGPAKKAALPVVTEFDEPFSFAYLSFQKTATVRGGVAHVTGADGRGGAGVVRKMDLRSLAGHTLAAWVKVGPKNRAKAIKLLLGSGQAKRTFSCRLAGVGAEKFIRVLADPPIAVSPAVADEPDVSFDPAKVEVLQIQGDWSGDAVDVYVDKVELVPATEAMKAPRLAYARKLRQAAERKRKQAERQRKEKEKLLAGAPHGEDGPWVVGVGAVAKDTLAVEIQAGEIVPRKQVPYEPAPGDEISGGRNPTKVLAWQGGRIVEADKGNYVTRAAKPGGTKRQIGALVAGSRLLAPGPAFRGQPLTTATVGEPRAYRITSKGHPAYEQARHPEKVFVKSMANGQAGGKIAACYHVYLKLAEPLKEHATYTIDLVGVNTREAAAAYTHDPRKARCEAIHVTQIGYRPSDPFKRAYLSLWMGTGGKVSYDAATFELIDAKTGRTVHAGKVTLGFPADRKEIIRGGKNHTQTNVYYLDFPEFARAGEYRVHVPGLGVSYPFTIGEDVWRKAFKVSMHGLLSHRSGLELGPPITSYKRPRPMHPADGVKVFKLDVTFWNGEAAAVQRCLRRMLGEKLDPAALKTHPGAWGGYMDAGDWDRRSQHLTATWAHLELADLFGGYFEKLKLALPPAEANDKLPDVINEALWNLDLYRRLQRGDGGVGGGVESTSHPRPGEASWQESLLLGTFAPDPETSLRYAACAAKAARLVRACDAKLADEYAASAKRTWAWANANEESVIQAEAKARGSRPAKDPAALRQVVTNARALAAVALYRLTREKTYHEAFRRATALRAGGDAGKQLASTFAYACLPDELADADLKAKAVAWFERAAADSMTFARDNAFNLTCRVPTLPVIGYVAYTSAPETTIGPVLPRAHYLTGKAEYLRGALAAAQFSAGANPMNMTLTTGLGRAWPRHPLHVDSQHAGFDPPIGITVYGPSDPALTGGHVDWAHTWFLSRTMIPPSRTWPTSEFYTDLGNWPPMNEYTVHQTIGPTSFYWGYLAARPAGADE